MSYVTPESIFMRAAKFRVAQKALDGVALGESHGTALVEPLCVLAAFTTELMLKCLICIEGGSPPTTHDLLGLFDKLSGPTRKRLDAMWTDFVRLHQHEIEQFERESGAAFERKLTLALEAGRKAFERIRYFYERPPSFSFYISRLPDMLAKVAFELRPDWNGRAEMFWPAPG